MEITESTILEIWEHFSDYIPPGKKNDAAAKFLRIVIEHGVDLDDLEDLREEDENIDNALDELKTSVDEDYIDDTDYEEE